MNTKSTTFPATILSLLLAFGLIASLPGCFPRQPVHQYTLTVEPPSEKPSPQNASRAILIGPVKLASYLDQPRIIRRHGTTRIEAAASRQWAGNLRDMISNKLVAEMGSQCAPLPVIPYPATAPVTQGKRIAIDLLRFEGTDDMSATIEARWTLFHLGDKSIAGMQTALIQVPCNDDSYEALTTALSQGLSQLAQKMAQTILVEQK